MVTGKLTKTIVEAAIAGFEAQKKDLDSQIAELRSMLSDAPAEPTGGTPGPASKRRFSAAARQRMREAQQARWAKIKGHAPAKKAAAKAKGGITAAGRKALSDAMKKRWAAKRAAAKKGA